VSFAREAPDSKSRDPSRIRKAAPASLSIVKAVADREITADRPIAAKTT
jgi:hypothetical protein